MNIKGNIMFWLLLDLRDFDFVAVFYRLYPPVFLPVV